MDSIHKLLIKMSILVKKCLSDYHLKPREKQLFKCVMARTRDDSGDVCFVLDQHAYCLMMRA